MKGYDLSKVVCATEGEVGIFHFRMTFFFITIEYVEFSKVIPSENTNSTESNPKHECTKNKKSHKFPFSMAYSTSGNIEPNKRYAKPLSN